MCMKDIPRYRVSASAPHCDVEGGQEATHSGIKASSLVIAGISSPTEMKFVSLILASALAMSSNGAVLTSRNAS